MSWFGLKNGQKNPSQFRWRPFFFFFFWRSPIFGLKKRLNFRVFGEIPSQFLDKPCDCDSRTIKFGSRLFAVFSLFQKSPPFFKSWLRAWGYISAKLFTRRKNLFDIATSILAKKSCLCSPTLLLFHPIYQRWSRGHKARGQGQGQGHKKNPRPRPRPRTAFSRTDTLEAKDRNARGQGQGPRTQAQVFSEKKVFKNFFRRSPIHWRTQNFWLGEA